MKIAQACQGELDGLLSLWWYYFYTLGSDRTSSFEYQVVARGIQGALEIFSEGGLREIFNIGAVESVLGYGKAPN